MRSTMMIISIMTHVMYITMMVTMKNEWIFSPFCKLPAILLWTYSVNYSVALLKHRFWTRFFRKTTYHWENISSYLIWFDFSPLDFHNQLFHQHIAAKSTNEKDGEAHKPDGTLRWLGWWLAQRLYIFPAPVKSRWFFVGERRNRES